LFVLNLDDILNIKVVSYMNNRINYLDCEGDSYIDDSREKKYDSYSLEDCVLVRTTDIFPGT